jgi:hypothetical protein
MKYIFLIKYIKSVLWRVAKHLSYIQDARCLKVKGVDVAAYSRSLDVSCTDTIGISTLEEVSLVCTCMVLDRKGPVLSKTTDRDAEVTAGA